MSKPSRNSLQQFTLIEMLVVIAIIGILAAMLMPSLQKAMNSAYKTSCMNNMKGVGIASMLYNQDYSDWMIYQGAWDNSINFNVGYLSLSYPYVAETNMPATGPLAGTYRCPAGNDDECITGNSRGGAPLTDYRWNRHTGSGHWYYPMRKVNRCRRTSVSMLCDSFFSATSKLYNFADFAWCSDGTLADMQFRHYGENNHLRVDGAVMSRDYAQILYDRRNDYCFHVGAVGDKIWAP